jgi:hypothetical protein
MKNKPEITNLEKTLEILEVLDGYIDDNNEIKPEFFMKLDLITRCLSIFSGVPVEEVDTSDVFGVVASFDFYIKTNEILEANKLAKKFRLR